MTVSDTIATPQLSDNTWVSIDIPCGNKEFILILASSLRRKAKEQERG